MMFLVLAFSAQAAAGTPAAPPPATVAGLPIGALPRQNLPAKGCAAYLWTVGADKQLVAMVTADPPQIRLAPDGVPVDYARTAQIGVGGYGFAASSRYRGGDLTAALDLTIVTKAGLTEGATVPEATLMIDRTGRDTIVLPVAGLIGCTGS